MHSVLKAVITLSAMNHPVCARLHINRKNERKSLQQKMENTNTSQTVRQGCPGANKTLSLTLALTHC